ncbi:MAG: 4'-phosphopantetheinyl transferase superfamily protein [Clostridia bacterium]|nr:4'-phosphopantetheinyl transferase superfamily protein [Clostridia bacterium]
MKVYYTRKRESSEAFIKRVLCERYGVDNPEIKRGGNGKPYLVNSPLKIGVSHSGELTALAVGDCEVGLDIELRRNIKSSAIVRRLSEEERQENFFRLWTAKESYVKYLGSTLAHMLPSLKFYGGALYENGVPAPVFLTHFEIDNYCFTLCTAQKIEVETEEIL